MTDIVERLRQRAVNDDGQALINEAADVIEMHREAANQYRLVAEQQRDEIGRLRCELGNAKLLAGIYTSEEAHRRDIENGY